MFLLSVVGFAQDKTVSIPKGNTYVNVPIVAGDSIVESQTYWILVNCEQDYPMCQDVKVNLTDVSGTPSVAISLEARKFSTDSWTEIVAASSWTSTAITRSTTTPNRYRQFKIKMVATGTDQKTTLLKVEFKAWFNGASLSSVSITDGTATLSAGALTGVTTIDNSGLITATGGATITGAAVNLNASSNFAVNVGTGSTNAAVTIGGNSNTVAVNSSDWDITTTGAMSGIGAIVTDGTFDNVVVNSVAGGDKGINESITQVAGTALTGNLIGAGIVATNGTSAATGGVIYGIEAKARAADASNAGSTIGRLTGVYASVDAKTKEATTMRAFEASLDGGAGGTSTEAVAFEAFNNSSATQTASYAYSVNGGTNGGHKVYTADFRTSSGTLIITGAATTRQGILDSGEDAPVGSIYISSGAGGHVYVKVAHTNATSDWNVITTTAAD